MNWLAILSGIGVGLVVTFVLFWLDKKRDRERTEYLRLHRQMLADMRMRQHLLPCPYKRRTYEV